MNNNSLTEVIAQIKSQITVDSEGKSTFTLRSISRLANIDNGQFSKQLRLTNSKLFNLLVNGGISPEQILNFGTTGVPDTVVPIIFEYYAYHSNKPSTQAIQCMRAYAAVGVRVWAQDIKGWKKRAEKAESESYLDKTINSVVLSELKQMKEAYNDVMNKLSPAAIEHFGFKKLTSESMPGVNDLFNDLADNGFFEYPEGGDTFTAKQWLEREGLVLSEHHFKVFCQRLSYTKQMFKYGLPEKVNGINRYTDADTYWLNHAYNSIEKLQSRTEYELLIAEEKEAKRLKQYQKRLESEPELIVYNVNDVDVNNQN